jgi:hypothetical protein
MKLYDSSAEALAAARLAELGFVRCNARLEQTFMDRSSQPFNACPDFYNKSADLYMEYKPCKLNSRGSQAIANRALGHAEKWGSSPYNKILHSWSNSLFKQAAVQDVLTPQNFVVVFDTLPELKAAKKYARHGLVFCTLASLRTYVGYAKLQKAGVAIGFKLPIGQDAFTI